MFIMQTTGTAQQFWRYGLASAADLIAQERSFLGTHSVESVMHISTLVLWITK